MVGGAVGICIVEQRDLSSTLELLIVIQSAWLVGIDMPFRHAADLRGEAGAGKCVVERAVLPFENVGIGVGQAVALIGVACTRDDGNRVFHRVGIEIAHNEEVCVAAAGGVCGKPVDQRGGGVGAGDVAVALSVSRVGIA